jgi:DNA helicase HerA-like ATPase
VPPELLAVVKTGRKVGLQSVFLTQEPRELNETLLAEGTEFVCFRIQGLNSLGKLADYGFPHQEELPTLPRGHLIGWNKLSGGVRRGRLF